MDCSDNVLIRQQVMNSGFRREPNLLNKFRKNKLIGSSDVSVYTALMDCINEKTGKCCPRQSTIAKKVGLSRQRVNQILVKLKKLGFISVVQNGFYSCEYEFSSLDDVHKNNKSMVIADLHPPDCGFAPLIADLHIYSDLNSSDLVTKNNMPPSAENSVLNSDLVKEEDISEVVGLKIGSVNEVLLKEIPPTPLLNDTQALDANALIADSQEIRLKLVRSSKKKPTGQLVLRSSFVDDEGTIHIQLITNESPTGLTNDQKNESMAADESLRAANDRIEGNMFTKAQQVGPRPEKKKKGISNRSQKKDNRFEVAYDRFYQACQKNGYDCPSKHQSNRQIDLMIEAYGVERFSQLVECAVENWINITDIVKSFTHRPVPTLGEISLGFVCEHLNAHLVAKEKGILGKPKKKRKSKKDKNTDKDMSFLDSIIDEASNG